MILDKILKAPLILLGISGFAAGIYAAYYKISGVTWGAPITLGIIVILYFIGSFIGRKKDKNANKQAEVVIDNEQTK